MDAVFSHSPVPSWARVEYLLKRLILLQITLIHEQYQLKQPLRQIHRRFFRIIISDQAKMA